jgi:hypothetical protein
MRKNTFEKKGSLSGLSKSPEFRVDLAGQLIYSGPTAGPDFE